MCLISLSRVLEMSWSRCTVGFATIVGSYDVLPPLPLVMNWVSPLKLSYRIESLRTLDVCLARVYLLWSTCGFVTIGNLCIWVGTHWFMWVLDVCFGDQLAGSWHWEPMHKGWHTFWLSGRNFGALFEVLCVGWIDDSEIVWCISYNHTHGYLRWQWSI